MTSRRERMVHRVPGGLDPRQLRLSEPAPRMVGRSTPTSSAANTATSPMHGMARESVSVIPTVSLGILRIPRVTVCDANTHGDTSVELVTSLPERSTDRGLPSRAASSHCSVNGAPVS